MAAEGKGGGAGRTAWEAGALIAHRFRVLELIGRGGSSSAYRVLDELTDSVIALKVLDRPEQGTGSQALTESFEREFHALKHLAHPRVVQVRDYGITRGLPFFTLELLDGGDLQALSPLPWREVCGVAYDIASALSLLHSRRLLHRDITPRNIRRTPDGKAKLFDFGLLSPMGAPSLVRGTPPYVAPELVQRSALDARSATYALGVTLYYALTKRVCFPARSFSELRDLWRSNPPAPSRFVPEIPAALDDLILEMIRLDVASRPKSAAEVMNRLRALLPSPPDEELSAANSYLVSPRLFGRDSVILQFRQLLLHSVRGRGGGFVIGSEPGMGRTRLLDAFVLEAKLLGATTLRANPIAEGTKPFASAAALARELLGTRPETAEELLRNEPGIYGALFRERAGQSGASEIALLPFDRTDGNRLQLHDALRGWLLDAARTQLLAIAVDDFEQIDEASAALLAALSHEASQHRLVYAFSATAQVRNDATPALDLLSERATRLDLRPLSAEETQALLASLFGQVPHLQLLGRKLHEVSGGRPRDCMLLAQHLVDRGIVRYADGIWLLPGELPADVLPRNMGESLERRIAALSPIARRTCLALAASVVGRSSRAQLTRLEAGGALEAVLDELRAAQLVVGAASGYALCDPSVARVLLGQASAAELADVHGALAELYVEERESPVAIAYHLIKAQRSELGILQLLAAFSDPLAQLRENNRAEHELGTDRTAATYALILREAEQLGRPVAELQMWRALLVGMCARGANPELYHQVASTWLERLKRDSGYVDWLALAAETDPLERARLAIARASERHTSAPPHERGPAPPDALRQLIGYVVMSLAIAVRGLDLRLQRSLPALLEPFALQNRLAEAMLWIARATCLNGEGKREKARELFVVVLQRMEGLSNSDLPYLDKVRAAISQTICEIDASLGVDSRYLAELDSPRRDPNQRVGAHYIQKVMALNRGDWDAAERHRLDAELLSLQIRARSMFSTLGQELEAHALARDLTGVKQVRDRIGLMASRHPGWAPVLRLADAHYLRLCGDLQAALQAAVSVVEPDALDSGWTMQARAVQIELLVELQRPDAAIELGEHALARCLHDDMAYLARGVSCALTLAEAALGRYDQALSRVRLVIAELLGLGVTGLQLGRAYECSARVAIAMRDREAFAEDAARVEEQYRRGCNSVLGALYERLLEDARRSGGSLDPMLSHSDLSADDSEAVTS